VEECVSELAAGKNRVSDAAEPAAGRLRLRERRQAFMQAATAVFLEKGYAGATLDDVIARSGGSRQTLYTLFGGKQGIFEALVAERSASIFEPFSEEDLNDRAPEEVLPKLGARYLDIITTPDALGVYRLVVGESSGRKELVELFWRYGPGAGRAQVARYFASLAKRGVLHLRDPEQSAGLFLGMLIGTMHMECLLGVRGTPSTAEIEAQVSDAVTQFLFGCR
jgi:TetR/AcrR family transcriptional repressor of mexJK operon